MSMSAHPGDLLSAYLDGELTPRELEDVSAHLEGCVECRRELQSLGEVRTLVRDLPPVDPPFGLFERMLQRKNRWGVRAGVAALAAGAVASVAMMGMAAPREAHVAPHVAQLVDAHTASASTSGDPISGMTPAAVPVSFQP